MMGLPRPRRLPSDVDGYRRIRVRVRVVLGHTDQQRHPKALSRPLDVPRRAEEEAGA